MAMSEPSAAWISMLSSGVSSIFEPSRWFWKRHALLGDFAQLGERPDLEAAGVGQERPPPGGEAVQAAHFADQLVAGPQPEVVGVAEDDLSAQQFQSRPDAGF